MIKTLKKLADALSPDQAKASSFEPQALAVAALMLEAAAMDGQVDQQETDTMQPLLMKAFDLTGPEAADLVEMAREARRKSNQIIHFTRDIKDNIPFGERAEIMELFWGVVLADGKVHDYEANLMRRIAGLIHVTDRQSGAARKRAEAKFALAQGREVPLED